MLCVFSGNPIQCRWLNHATQHASETRPRVCPWWSSSLWFNPDHPVPLACLGCHAFQLLDEQGVDRWHCHEQRQHFIVRARGVVGQDLPQRRSLHHHANVSTRPATGPHHRSATETRQMHAQERVRKRHCTLALGANSTVAPAHSGHSNLLLMPCVWCNGKKCRMRSLGVYSHAVTMSVICACSARCVCTTPLGFPVCQK